MTISHHPGDETLHKFAVGLLTPGLRIVVAVHLEGCVRCRHWIGDLEILGGMLLAEMPPTPMAPDALARILARLDEKDHPVGLARQRSLEGLALPKALEACAISPWRWFGPGMHWSRVRLPWAPDANVVLFRIGASRRMPVHRHTGLELTQVLTGSFSDQFGEFKAGDLEEADGQIEHQPVVDSVRTCICLAAVEGRIHPRGAIATVVQRVIGL